jgi:hypothetical protein
MVECPQCYAEPGQKCPIPGNPHIARLIAAANEFRAINAPLIMEQSQANRARLLLTHATKPPEDRL